MINLSFEWDSRDLQAWRTNQVERALTRALSKAGGDAARFLRTGSSRLVRQRKRIKAERVSRGLPLAFPHNARDIAALIWEMKVSGAAIPVVDFPHAQTGRGVSVAINVGKRVLIKSAFVATMRSGHTGVFLRRGAPRLPIQEAFTSRISDVFLDTGFIPLILGGAQAKFRSSFDRLLPIELGKLES